MRHLVTVNQIEEIKSIPGADSIEAARIKGWWVVVRKGEFKVGDSVLFYEIDSFLPIEPQYEFLLKGSKPRKMLVDDVEKEGIRLRTIKLRGQISQGLIMPIPEGLVIPEDGDVTEQLGVIKYEIPLPPQLVGKVLGNFPSFIPKTDEERIQNMAEVLLSYYVTEKIDGTSVTYYKKDGKFGVCSRNLELAEGDTTQWMIARKLSLADKLPEGIALQGELVGPGIQGNSLKLTEQKVYFFNVYNFVTGIYLPFKDFVGFCKSMEIETVPILDENFSLLPSVDEMLRYASGKSSLNPLIEREGVVIRSKFNLVHDRVSFKVINNDYLLKNEQ